MMFLMKRDKDDRKCIVCGKEIYASYKGKYYCSSHLLDVLSGGKKTNKVTSNKSSKS